jgi:hypothetical protein
MKSIVLFCVALLSSAASSFCQDDMPSTNGPTKPAPMISGSGMLMENAPVISSTGIFMSAPLITGTLCFEVSINGNEITLLPSPPADPSNSVEIFCPTYNALSSPVEPIVIRDGDHWIITFPKSKLKPTPMNHHQ